MKVKVKQGENVIFLQANVRTSQHIYFQNNKMEINLEIEKKNIKKKKGQYAFSKETPFVTPVMMISSA